MEREENQQLIQIRESTRGAVNRIREDLRQLKRIALVEKLSEIDWDSKTSAQRDEEDGKRLRGAR